MKQQLLLLSLITLFVFSQGGYEGQEINYELILDWSYGSPDGVARRVLSVNNQFPGPTLEGNTGDTFIIDVVNKLDRSLSIHWHGLFQQETTNMDGAAFISECPIPPKSTKTFKFTLNDQHGTYWYHSHFMNEIVDGCKGAIIIHRAPDDDGEPYNYAAETLIQVTDWYHTAADILWAIMMSPPYPPSPEPDTILINGIGQLPNCYGGDDSCVYSVVEASLEGYTRIRLVNTAAFLPVIVSIDDHVLIITEVDGVDVAWKDVTPEDINKGKVAGYISHLRINVAQRYSFIAVPINGKPKYGDNFWIRAVLDTGQFAGGATSGYGGSSPTYGGYKGHFSTPENVDQSTHRRHRKSSSERYSGKDVEFYGPNRQGPSYDENVPQENGGVKIALGVLSYGKCSKLPETEDFAYDAAKTLSSLPCPECLPCNDLHPIEDLSPPEPTKIVTVDIGFIPQPDPSQFSQFNNISCSPTDWGYSAFDFILMGKHIPPTCLNYEVSKDDKVVLVINNPSFGEHPIHLHGHLFWVLSQGSSNSGNYNPRNSSQPKWQWNNPLYRDSVTVNPFSYVIVMFESFNFGVWFMHCHIDWHMMGGLALIINEMPRETAEFFGYDKHPEECVYTTPPPLKVTLEQVRNSYKLQSYTCSFPCISAPELRKQNNDNDNDNDNDDY